MTYHRHTYHGIVLRGSGDVEVAEAHLDHHQRTAKAMSDHLRRGTDPRTGRVMSVSEFDRIERCRKEAQKMADLLAKAVEAFKTGQHDAPAETAS